MNLLLDTHVFIWANSLPDRLSPRVEALLFDDRNRLYLSAASVWEIATKHTFQKRHFSFPESTVLAGIQHLQCKMLAVDARHTLALFRLPLIHRDPFDRILLAQAWTDNLVLVTADRRMAEYPALQTLW